MDSTKTKHLISEIHAIATFEEDNEKNNVDLSELKKINPDTMGWIQVSDTEVNYPFTQTDNNDLDIFRLQKYHRFFS